MKLIPEELIEKAADSRAEKLFADNCGGEYAVYELKFMCKNDFMAGARFTEEKLAQLTCEFIEEVIGEGWILRADGWQNTLDYKISETTRKTTEQLFEEFINIKKQQL